MKALILIALTSCFAYHLNAQHTPNRWVIGLGTGGPWNNQELSFSSGNMVSQALPGINNPILITNASIGDANSNLLFYTNGLNIYYKFNNVIKDGDSINPSAWNNPSAMIGGMPLPQMAVFIPDPSDSNRFYLFHGSVDINYQPCSSFGGGDFPTKLYYTLIDKTLDNGNGGVVSKNNIVMNDTIGNSLVAIKHGNGRDWWLIACHPAQPLLYSWLITAAGVSGPYYQTIGAGTCGGYWNLKFSASANKIAGFETFFDWPHTRYIDLYDFDRCSGLLSNAQTLQMTNIAKYSYAGGCEFSPSGRYLYGCAINKLYQFDMLAANIQASKMVVDSVDSLDFGNYKMWGVSQLAPDGKIYSKIPNSIPFLSVINYPDSAGIACNAVHGGIALPNYHYGDLPNIPLYELGPLTGSACDTITGSPPAPKGGDLQMKIYPNPALNQLAISFPTGFGTQLATGKLVTVSIYDVLSKLQLQQNVTSTDSHFNLDVSNLSSGIYFVQVMQGHKVYNVKFVKE